MPIELTINLFGAPDIHTGGESIRVDTRKAIAMIAYLALNPGPQTRDALSTLLWPDLNQTRARAALRRTLSVLNRTNMAPWLAITRANVALSVDENVEIDVAAFDRLVDQCSEHDHDSDQACIHCIEPLTAAVARYRDDFMAGFTLRDSVNFDDWQFFTTEELRRDFVRVLDRLIEALTLASDFEAAIDHARRRLYTDPLHEAAHRQLMRLFVWADQRNAALRQYRACVRVLDEELGVPPMDETTELYELIRGHQPIPKPMPPNARQSGIAPAPPIIDPPLQSAGATELVGREAAWATLERTLTSAPSGHLVIIEGEAGIGKTALLDHFLASIVERGYETVRAQCYQGESELAYAPVRELLRAGIAHPDAGLRLENVPDSWLAEVGKLVPELELISQYAVAQPALDELSAKGRFFEAISQVLGALTSERGPTFIAIDNVHWADNATLELIGYIARRLRDLPFCLLLSWRTEEFVAGELRRVIGYAANHDVEKSEIVLARLTVDNVERLLTASALADAKTRTRLSQRLMDVSAGIPLFLVEYLALLHQSPSLIDEPDWVLPSGIRNLLQSRLDPISDAGRQLLTAAAVIGRSFDYDILRAVSGRSDDECVYALEELLAHRLVRELDGSEYDFYHDQLRGLVYEKVSRARRRLLHRRVADALTISARRESGEQRTHSATLAYHHAEGDQIEQAIAGYIDAAGQAASIYANSEAIQYLERALALGAHNVADIHEQLGDLHLLLGEYAQARNDFESAAARATGKQSARLEGKLGDLHHRLGNYPLAARHFEIALTAERIEQAWRCRILAQWSLTADRDEDHVHALELAEQALAASTELGDPLALSEAHNVLSILARHDENATEAVKHAQRSLAFAEESAASSARMAALNSLALAHAIAEEYRLAIALTEEALAVSLAQGDRHRAAALHNHLADYHHELGEDEVAHAQMMQAVEIFAEINADGLNLNPEIWKLIEW